MRHEASSVAYMQLPVILRVWVDLARKHNSLHSRAHLHPPLNSNQLTEEDCYTRVISASETYHKAAAVETSPCRHKEAVPSLHCLQWSQAI